MTFISTGADRPFDCIPYRQDREMSVHDALGVDAVAHNGLAS